MDSPSLLLARAVVRAGQAMWRALPAGARKRLEDRAFYAVFQLTRVENDAYGWRPDRAGSTPGPDAPSPSAGPARRP